MGTTVKPSWMRYSKIWGNASGVCKAALWNRTMLPSFTREVTRSQMVAAS